MNAFVMKEFGNIAYVVDGGFGVYTGNRPKRVAKAVCDMFQNETVMKAISDRCIASSHMHATKQIAKDIATTVLAKR